MKKALFAIFLVALTPARAQLIGELLDAPQHGFAVGVGIGPTTHDFSVVAGFAERLSSSTGTYSYSGVSIVPAIITNTNGTKSLSVTPVAHTGVKQILYQQGRFTLAVDGGAGASLPSTSTSAFNFAAAGGVDLVWRLNRKLNTAGGSTNNYVAIHPQFTQLTGTPGGTVVSLGIAWVHGVN
jgi:hypothetical protein